jgi:putative hemolysin
MEENPTKRTVLDYDDIRNMCPFFNGKEKLVNRIFHLISMDKVNWLHEHNCDTPGEPFVEGLVRDLNISVRIDNEEILDSLPDGAFITVSNHPFGALDGILLIKIVASHYPKFRVMVNMFLNYISAMRPNFIPVDPLGSNDPKKKLVTMKGIREAIAQVRGGQPMGFFPAGAVSKITETLHIQDRKWQPTIIRLIQQLNVPVVPIYFHGHNSVFFNILGLIDWRLRTLRLPAEVFRKKGETIHVSIGKPIPVEELAKHKSIDDLGRFLKKSTYSMCKWK